MNSKKSHGKCRQPGIRFVTEFVHWRTKKVMRASDYGYKAWPVGKDETRILAV